jgi:hypothetical protein
MFRSQNKTTKEKAEKSYDSHPAHSLDRGGDRTLSRRSLVEIHGITSTMLQDFNLSMSPSAEDIAVCEFYYTTLDNLSHEDDARFLHAQLPALYSQSSIGSVLRLSAQAIAYACLTKTEHRAAEVSRERYIMAVKAAEAAIQDPVEVRTDQTLYAILLLCGFEVRLLYLHRRFSDIKVYTNAILIKDYYV